MVRQQHASLRCAAAVTPPRLLLVTEYIRYCAPPATNTPLLRWICCAEDVTIRHAAACLRRMLIFSRTSRLPHMLMVERIRYPPCCAHAMPLLFLILRFIFVSPLMLTRRLRRHYAAISSRYFDEDVYYAIHAAFDRDIRRCAISICCADAAA